jgi:hypothetical protein
MREKERFHLAMITAEMMYTFMEAEYQNGERNLDLMMRRLKDLSAYSLTHAEIMNQRQGVELLALGMFFGMSSEDRFQRNQSRLQELSADALAYPGEADVIEREVEAQQKGKPPENKPPAQPRLF